MLHASFPEQKGGIRIGDGTSVEPQVLERRSFRIQHDIVAHQKMTKECLDLIYSEEATRTKTT